MLSGKPYFSLVVEAHSCVGMVSVNGQSLWPLEMAPVKVTLPVNHWVAEGENGLQVMVAPIDDEGDFGSFSPAARCTLTLKVRTSGTGSEGDGTVAALLFAASDPTGIGGNTPERRLDSTDGFSPSDGGDVLVGPAKREAYQEVVAVCSRTVTLPAMALPRWKFLDSDPITGIAPPDIDARIDDSTAERIKGELLPIYRGIWDALEAGRVDDILPLYAERCEETDASLFHEPGHTAARLAAALEGSVAAADERLWPITDNNVALQVSDNDRLARLCQNNLKPLLSFDILPAGGARHYDAVFRKSGGEWILTR